MKNSPSVSLQTALTLTEWSERTMRRRLAEGILQTVKSALTANKVLISLQDLQADTCIPLPDENLKLLLEADKGDADAQNDLALIFLAHGKYKSAVYWLEAAAKQNCADAMHLLGCCYLTGEGLVKDDNLAMIWIAKAASLEHSIACAQMKKLATKKTKPTS
jgi:TPR repeat protein